MVLAFCFKYRNTETPKKKMAYVRANFFYEHKAKARESRTNTGYQNPRPLQLIDALTNEPEKRGGGSEYSLSCAARERPHKTTYTHTHEIYSRSMKLHKWPPACHQLGPPGTHGRPRDSFSAGPQNPEEPHPPCNAMRHTTACLSRACLWLGSLLWGEY